MPERQPNDIKESERQDFDDESNLDTAHDSRALGERALAIALRELGSEAVARAVSDKSSTTPLEKLSQKPSNNNDFKENNETMGVNDLPIMLSDEDVFRYWDVILEGVKQDEALIDDLKHSVAAEDRKNQFQGALYTMNPVISSGIMVLDD